MSVRPPGWLADPALREVWGRVRARVERAGLVPEGKVRVSLSTRDERHAVSALLGRSVTRETVVLDLGALDARLRERSGLGGLLDVLVAVSGSPLVDRPAERTARLVRREEPLELARKLVDTPWSEPWVADLRRTGLLSRASDGATTVREAAAVLSVVTARGSTERGWSRVELAAQVVGDAHALDEDRLLHRVVLRGLAAASGAAPPVAPQARRALWESFGVSPDLLSTTCLTLGLPLSRLGPGPVHLTRWDLRRASGFAPSERLVLVCENPRVLEAAAEQYAGRIAVVCTSGEPNTVTTAVLGALVAAGRDLRYHGDFDWPGIAIANRVVARFGTTPLLMAAGDYERSVRVDAPELFGPPVEPVWDPELGAVMRARGRSLHEETVLPQVLEALDSWP